MFLSYILLWYNPKMGYTLFMNLAAKQFARLREDGSAGGGWGEECRAVRAFRRAERGGSFQISLLGFVYQIWQNNFKSLLRFFIGSPIGLELKTANPSFDGGGFNVIIEL